MSYAASVVETRAAADQKAALHDPVAFDRNLEMKLTDRNPTSHRSTRLRLKQLARLKPRAQYALNSRISSRRRSATEPIDRSCRVEGLVVLIPAPGLRTPRESKEGAISIERLLKQQKAKQVQP